MSEFKGTPGAWEVRVEQIAPGSNATCFTVATDDFDVVSPLLGIRCEDDAALIAAAPDLLDELVEADKTLCALQSNVADAQKREPRWEGVWQEIQSRRDSIRAAIAKALNTDTTER